VGEKHADWLRRRRERASIDLTEARQEADFRAHLSVLPMLRAAA
jgi:hypothetical protein